MVRRAISILAVIAVILVSVRMWREYRQDQWIENVKRRLTCPADVGSRLPVRGTARADEAPAVALAEIGTFEEPVGMAARPGDEALYILEKVGRVVRWTGATGTVLVDLTDEVSHGREQGLLGLAFSPDGRYLYTNHTDRSGDTHITEWTLDRGGPPRRREVLEVDQPHEWHNGGQLAFGPDGLLYIGLGDGGTLSDLWANGQDLGTPLGKLLRIRPRPSGDRAYTVPKDNPFVGVKGARSEIWAYGLRNPWRFSFDPDTGDLWIADVGDGCFEELDHQPGVFEGGANYGWRNAEGAWMIDPPVPPNYVAPVYSFRRDGKDTCAVVGGYVYRGTAIPALRGWYLFGDFCHGDLLAWRGPGMGEPLPLGISVGELSSFGVDRQGELYALSLAGKVFRLQSSAG